MSSNPIVHIPTASGLACGTRSLTAEINSESLCDRCRSVLERKIRAAIILRFQNTSGYKSIGEAEATRRADLVLDDVFGRKADRPS